MIGSEGTRSFTQIAKIPMVLIGESKQNASVYLGEIK